MKNGPLPAMEDQGLCYELAGGISHSPFQNN